MLSQNQIYYRIQVILACQNQGTDSNKKPAKRLLTVYVILLLKSNWTKKVRKPRFYLYNTKNKEKHLMNLAWKHVR